MLQEVERFHELVECYQFFHLIDRSKNMKCTIKETEKEIKYQIGEPKEIVVDKSEWEKDGHRGATYSYHMSKERFERTNLKCYNIYVGWEDKAPEGAEQEVKLCTMGYYDFVDFNYEDCLGERMLEMVAKKLMTTVDEVLKAITKPLKDLQSVVRDEFSRTEEFRVKKQHEEVLQKYKKAKHDFMMQYGFSAVDYDRCYNVFGQLMDAEYLSQLNKRLEEREAMRNQSRRYRKTESQKRFHEYLHASRSVEYSEQEQLILSKFYKLLAKKYHPDANPGVDTSEEMTLLNKVKKEWGI